MRKKKMRTEVSVPYETKEGGLYLMTPCPYNQKTKEGHGYHIKVGSGSCRECGRFVSDDVVARIVMCKSGKRG